MGIRDPVTKLFDKTVKCLNGFNCEIDGTNLFIFLA
jgi:hypothetical protein